VNRLTFSATAAALPKRFVPPQGTLVWVYCAYEMPDDDTTVLIAVTGQDEPWPAWHDGDGWHYADASSPEGEVYAWAEMPGVAAILWVRRCVVSTPRIEIDEDEREESWAEIVLIAMIALAAGLACAVWDGAVDAWRAIARRSPR